MKVGIIIHSYTGNTLSVAERLRERLLESGHTVSLERVTAVNEDPSAAKNVQLKSKPDISTYDALIFGCPVRGFSMSPVMKAYMQQLPLLKGKKVGCFVTQYFPFPWMGGDRSIGEMKQTCKDKGECVFDAGIVNWSHIRRESKIQDVLQKLSRL